MEQRKEIVFVNLRCGNFVVRNILALIEGPSPPLALLTLTALTPSQYKTKILNHKIFWWPWDFWGKKLVAITCFSANAAVAYQLADQYRRKGVCVIMGGPHVNALPQEALEHCDSVIQGEAESVWKEVLADFENGRLKKQYQGSPLDDFFTPVFPYFLSLTPWQILSAGVQTTRGCKYFCEFCASTTASFRTIQQEQVLALADRVKHLARFIPLYLKDDNIYADPAYAKELFRKLIPLRMKWFSSASLDIALDDEALQLAKESGCVWLGMGFETIYPEYLAKTSLDKRVKTSQDVLMLIRKIQSYGIGVRGSFILGFDYYTHLDYLRMLVFFVRARFYFIALNILTPFPGSRLYQRLDEEKRIISHDWRKFDCLHVVFRPHRMSVFALQAWFVVLRTVGFLVAGETAFVSWFVLIYFLVIFPRLIS